MFQALIELSLLAIVLFFLVTQVIIPIKQGEPLFPIFLKQRKDLAQQVDAANEEVVEERMRDRVQTTKDKAEALRTRRVTRNSKVVKPTDEKGENA